MGGSLNFDGMVGMIDTRKFTLKVIKFDSCIALYTCIFTFLSRIWNHKRNCPKSPKPSYTIVPSANTKKEWLVHVYTNYCSEKSVFHKHAINYCGSWKSGENKVSSVPIDFLKVQDTTLCWFQGIDKETKQKLRTSQVTREQRKLHPNMINVINHAH